MSSCFDPSAPAARDSSVRVLLDLIGRLIMTHRLAPGVAVAALGVTTAEAVALIDHGHLPSLNDARHDRVRLVANIL